MKVITTGLLNRFWTKGIKPWLDKRIKSYADLMVTTASGYTPDALAVKEGFTELNGKLGEDSHYSFTKYGLTFDFFRKGCVCTFYIHGKTTEKLPLYNMNSRFIIPEKYAPCLTYDFSNEFIFPSRLRITSDGGFIDRSDETPIDTEIRVSGSYVCLI